MEILAALAALLIALGYGLKFILAVIELLG